MPEAAPARARYDLRGRVAVVTGAGGGFGEAIIARLVEAGAAVAAWDLAAIDEGRLGGGLSQVVDVGDAGGVEAAAAEVEARLGRIDILVANAGIVGPLATTWEYQSEVFRKLIEVNLIGAFNAVRAVAPVMLRAEEPRAGRIVAIASIQAKEGMALASGYSAAKAGLVALTKSLGKELAPHGILANCITPSASLTKMSLDVPPERLAEILTKIPLGRFLEPDEVAAMTLWLCSGECSFSTGAVFDLSGGRATY